MKEYLGSDDFSTDIVVAWAHGFDFAKRRFRKVYPNLSLPLCNFPNYTKPTTEYGEYENS